MDLVATSLKVVRVGIGNINEIFLEREWRELDSRSLVKLVLEFDPVECRSNGGLLHFNRVQM